MMVITLSELMWGFKNEIYWYIYTVNIYAVNILYLAHPGHPPPPGAP